MQPALPDHRDRSFPRTFGTVAATEFPAEYDCDAGFGMPDQNEDGYPMGCTGYAQTELCQDEDRIQYDPVFTYLKTLFYSNLPSNSPCDMRASLKMLVDYGPKPKAGTEQDASTHRRGGYYNVVDSPELDCFDDIRNALWLQREARRSVSIGTPWFPEWRKTKGDGVLMAFNYTGVSSDYVWHNWKCSGWKVLAGQPYLKVKSWQGVRIGDKGWLYLSRERANRLLSIRGVAAFTTAIATPSDVQKVKLSIMETVVSYCKRLLAQWTSS